MNYSLKNHKYKISSLQKNRNIINYLMIIMILGSFSGAFFANYINICNVERMSNFIDEFMDSYKVDNSYTILGFLEIFLKNAKYLIAIWFLAFIFFGNIFVWILDFVKGFNIGFTTAVFINKFFFLGIKYILTIYTFQNIIIIPLHIFISFKSIQYCNKKRNNTLEINDMKIYFKDLLVSITLNIIISLSYIFFV